MPRLAPDPLWNWRRNWRYCLSKFPRTKSAPPVLSGRLGRTPKEHRICCSQPDTKSLLTSSRILPRYFGMKEFQFSFLQTFLLRFFLSRRRHRIYIRHKPGVIFLARYELLDEVSADILAGIEDDFIPQVPTVVFTGINHRLWPLTGLGNFRIGIQTEHFFDDDGNIITEGGEPAHRTNEISKIHNNIRYLDAVLDINAANASIYHALPISEQSKIFFGPHIFPKIPSKFCPSTDKRFFFVGSPSERRKRILEKIDPTLLFIQKDELFGEALLERIREFSALLNLHRNDGICTEAPRILIALKAGKPLISEPLSREWKAGIHYVPIEELTEEVDYGAIYENMARLCSEEYSFQDFLERLQETRFGVRS